MFDSKYSKVLKSDLEAITLEMQEMREQIATLTSRNKILEENQSEFLMSIVKRQSDTITKLSHYQEQDDALYSYEQIRIYFIPDWVKEVIVLQPSGVDKLEQVMKSSLDPFQISWYCDPGGRIYITPVFW